jgi:hypothetical protein
VTVYKWAMKRATMATRLMAMAVLLPLRWRTVSSATQQGSHALQSAVTAKSWGPKPAMMPMKRQAMAATLNVRSRRAGSAQVAAQLHLMLATLCAVTVRRWGRRDAMMGIC